MAEQATVVAELRNGAGKGVARATRRMGRVPAVIYGDKQEPMNISLDYKEILGLASKTTFFNHLVKLKVGGKDIQVLPRDVQLDPVTDRPIHVDFLRVSASTKVTVLVPAVFTNQDKCTGLRRGGVLNIVRREIELRCSPMAIPEVLSFSLEGLDIGASIHIDAVQLPDGVSPLTKRNFTVATIAPPTVMLSEEEEAQRAAAAAAAAGAAEGAAAAAPAEGDKAAEKKDEKK
jgi:large subunit ribosomal protein L25